jgi:acetolactate synthase-1/2/3 large subunit
MRPSLDLRIHHKHCAGPASQSNKKGNDMATCGEVLVKLLEGYGVEQVFGIPGVHTVELYRGLARSSINHVTPRHEQGAGFMADGYARTSGKPGVCFIITGPGMTNITTAMGQAYADSIPMLVISSVQSRSQLGGGRGKLHELPNQSALCAGVAAFSHTLMSASELPGAGPGLCAVPGRPSAPGAHRDSAGCAGGRRRRPARQRPGEHRPRRGLRRLRCRA